MPSAHLSLTSRVLARYCAMLIALVVTTSCWSGNESDIIPRDSKKSSIEVPEGVVERHISLDCADGGTAQPGALRNDVVVDGVAFEGLSTQRANQAAPAKAVLPGVGKTQDQLFFLKVPVYVPAGVEAVDIEILNAEVGSLLWVSAAEWTSGNTFDVMGHRARKVTLSGCPKRDVTFFGGLLLAQRSACVKLRITSSGPLPATLAAPFGSTKCG